MPTITLTNPTAGTVVSAGLHATNYTNLQTLLNGGLDAANLANNAVTTAKIADGAVTAAKLAAGAGGSAPAGSITAYIGTTAPTGWLLLDGSTVTNGQTLYPNLWAVLPAIYKSGSSIILPDLRGRVPVGLGTHADVNTIGNNDGLAVANRRPKHKHTGSYSGTTSGASQALIWDSINAGDSTTTGGGSRWIASSAHTHTFSGSVTVGPNTGAEPTDSEAYLVVNYIMKAD